LDTLDPARVEKAEFELDRFIDKRATDRQRQEANAEARQEKADLEKRQREKQRENGLGWLETYYIRWRAGVQTASRNLDLYLQTKEKLAELSEKEK
jgi:hypothetical protein